MTSTGHPEKDNNRPQISFETLYQEVVDLQIVEGFFSAVERKFLQVSNTAFDARKAKDTLLTLQDLNENGAPDDFLKASRMLGEMMAGWKRQLATRDRAIETEQIRRFCDEFKKPFDSKVFTALARFYLSLPHSLSTQSKYDFSVTRLFLKPTVNNVREIKFDRETVIEQLSALGTDCTIHSSFSLNTDQQIIEIITKFDEFIFEAEFITTFEELVNSRLFENLRDFKTQLGDLFYHPSVTASAIECNVFVGNIFAELLAQENEKLSRIISNEFDFAGVLHDTSPTAVVASNRILASIRTDTAGEAESPDDDARHIWEWLQSVCAKHSEKTEPEHMPVAPAVSYPAKMRVMHLLTIIRDPGSDKGPLFEYLQKSPALKSLDFGIFLSPETAEEQKRIFREILAAVIWAEELRANELRRHEDLTDETNLEIAVLLEELQELSGVLKGKMDELDSEVTHNLLYVSNQLLETRLKLERAIVRYSKQSLETAPVPEEKPEPAAAPVKERYSAPAFEVNRWVVAFCALVILFAVGLYFTGDLITTGGNVSRDMEIIETAKLPGKDNFNTAQRVRGSLHITAKETWKNLDENAQREILQQLLKYPAKTPIDNVVVMDNSGNEISTASPELIETTAQVVEIGK